MLQTGVIKKIHPRYGFIRADSGIDVFFLPTEVDPTVCPFRDLRDGDPVTFDTFKHERGLRGKDIRRISSDHSNAGTSAA